MYQKQIEQLVVLQTVDDEIKLLEIEVRQAPLELSELEGRLADFQKLTLQCDRFGAAAFRDPLEGYIRRMLDEIERFKREETRLIPAELDYATVPGLSTEIRERVRQGKSIRGFVTDGVAAYIARAGLYC